jgi:branched-subunit amino acid transport protein
MYEATVFALVGAGTLLMRAAFVVTPTRLPATLERFMRHAKPAILASLVGGFLAGAEGGITLRGVVGLAAAGLAARRGKSMLTVLGCGLAAAMITGL